MVHASSGQPLDTLEQANSLADADVQPNAGVGETNGFAGEQTPSSQCRDIVLAKASKSPRRVSVVHAKRLAPLYETVALGFALTGCVAGYFAWRLSEGTISISVAAPIVEQALERIVGGKTTIGELRLGWDDSRQDFVVTANKITATTDARTSPLALGQVNLTLNASALLTGKAQITRADITGLQAVLVIDKEGLTAFGFGTPQEVLNLPRRIAQRRSLRDVFDSVRRAVLPDGDKGQVEAIALTNATLVVIDPDTGERLTLANARANITTDANKIVTMQAAGLAAEMGGFANIAVSASPDAAQRLVLAANFDQASLSRLPASLRVGPLVRFKGDTVPISGNVLARLGDNLSASDLEAKLTLGQGQVQGIDLKRGAGSFNWSGSNGKLTVTNLSANTNMGSVESANVTIGTVKNGLRAATFDAKRFDFLSSRFGRANGEELRIGAQLQPDNFPASGSLSARTMNISRDITSNLKANGVNLILSRPNPRLASSLSLTLAAQGLSGTLQGRPLSGTGLQATVTANRRATQFSPLQVSATARRLEYELDMQMGQQQFDGQSVKLLASQFNMARRNLPATVSVTLASLGLGGQQNSFLTGRAGGVSLETTNLGTGKARAIGIVDSFVSGSGRLGIPSAMSRNIAFDFVQTGPSSGQLSRFQAQSLGLTVKSAVVNTNGLTASGAISRDGFSNASITSDRVEIIQSAQLPRPFQAQDLKVTGSAAWPRITLDAFSFRHNGVQLAGTTQIGFIQNGAPSIDLSADINGQFSVETLLSAWPRRFLPETRGNITRLVPSGTAQVTRLNLAIPAGMKPKQILPRSGMDLAFVLEDLTVTYLNGMSPITNISGEGLLTGNSLLIDLPTGNIGDIQLKDGTVEIAQFVPDGGRLAVDATVLGSVADMAYEIDLPPLAILSKSNFDPARLSGTGVAQVGLDIPLKRALVAGDIGVKVDADFQDGGLERTFAGLDATNGTGKLKIENNKVDVSGQALFANNLFDFNWSTTSAQGSPAQTALRATGDVSVASLSALGLDATSFANGRFKLNITANSQGASFGAAVIDADLLNTNITLPGNLWKKSEGVEGNVSANLYPREGGGWNVQDLRFASSGATLRGALDLSEDVRLVDARFSRVVIPNAADLALNVTPGPNGLTVTLRGEYLNLSPFLATKNVSEKAVDLFDRPLTLSADILRVATSNESELTNVHADIVRDLQGWRTLAATGASPAGVSRIRLMVERDGTRSVSGVLSDAGFFAQLLYPGAPIFGGSGVIEGELPVVGANSSGILSFTGKDITLARPGSSPILFANVQMPMSVRGGVVTLRDGQADGDAYTVKASGYVDVGAGRLDFRGVATPGGLNRVLADIPLFGAILGGGADEGLLGITFAAKGAMAGPRITINPVSALAPGFLRKLFESEAPLSPQPRLVVTTLAGDPIATKWPYGPTEDMSEAMSSTFIDSQTGPAQ